MQDVRYSAAAAEGTAALQLCCCHPQRTSHICKLLVATSNSKAYKIGRLYICTLARRLAKINRPCGSIPYVFPNCLLGTAQEG